jgi:hypothetical protein
MTSGIYIPFLHSSKPEVASAVDILVDLNFRRPSVLAKSCERHALEFRMNAL